MLGCGMKRMLGGGVKMKIWCKMRIWRGGRIWRELKRVWI